MSIHVANRQRRVRLDLGAIRRFSIRALALARAEWGNGPALLELLPEIEVTIVSDRKMAAVHRQFLAIDGSTDVITFQHGEIVVSADTARANAKDYGETLTGEIDRYIVHGLLHLNGFTDDTARASQRLHGLQEKILRQLRGDE